MVHEPLRRLAPVAALFAVCLITVSLPRAGLAANQPGVVASGDELTLPVCVPFPLIGVKHVLPVAAEPPSTLPTAATVYVYSVAGATVEQPRPPSTWTPLTATDEELDFYGIPAKPADPSGLVGWKEEWAQYSGFAPPGMCLQKGVRHGAATSPNWAGVAATGHSYTESYASIRQPHSTAVCPGSSDHAAWVGLGGYGGYPLLQNGTEDGPGSLNYITIWWEAFDRFGTDSGSITMQGLPSPGDNVNMATTYTPATSTYQATVAFGWHDVSAGWVQNSGKMTVIGTSPVTAYWDGSSAEAIDERAGRSGGGLYYLRKWDSGDVLWSNALVRFVGGSGQYGIRTVPHDGVNMYTNFMLADIPSAGSGTSFQAHWDSCG